jgi:hypothetical protein
LRFLRGIGRGGKENSYAVKRHECNLTKQTEKCMVKLLILAEMSRMEENCLKYDLKFARRRGIIIPMLFANTVRKCMATEPIQKRGAPAG